MGFRTGAYLTIWGDGNNYGGNYVCKQVSANRRNKETGEYEVSFRGFARFIGKAADVVRDLPVKSKVKVIDCDVTSFYKRDTNTTTFTFTVFDCETLDKESSASPQAAPPKQVPKKDAADPEPDDLPF